MRAVVQRVLSASVSVDGVVKSKIGQGLCVLLGIHREDKHSDVDFISRKILNTRFFDGANERRWDKSVVDMGFEVLIVSQFTLYHIQKGNKPDFHLAMNPEDAPGVYQRLLDLMRQSYDETRIKSGEFGAYMNVALENDGPVTLIFDSRNPKGGDS